MFLGELLPVSLAFTSSRSAFRARSIVASLSDPFCGRRDVLPVSILREACCRGRFSTGSARRLRRSSHNCLPFAHLKNSVIQNDLIASFTKLPVQGIEEIVRPQAADGV